MDSQEQSFTQSQLLSSLVTLYQSLQEYLLKFSQAANTDFSETTSFTWSDGNGDTHTMDIPSIGYIKSDITNIKEQLESLITNNDDTITLKYKDGTVKSFEMKKLSALIDVLNNTGNVQMNVPSELKYKNNWMFESFLNPLLVLPIDVSPLLTGNDVKKFSVRRLILNTPEDDQKKIFRDSFLGKNDIDYYDATSILNNYGIKFNIDDNEYEMPSAINAKRGNFSVIRKVKTKSNTGSPIIYYELDKLYYVNVLTNSSSGFTQLNIGDVLITSDDSEYVIEDIQQATRLVSLKRKFGHSPISIGVDNLKIKPEAYRVPELQVNVGYNEYELIFVKPVSSQLDLTTDQWTKGIGIYTNDLSIKLNNGKTISLPEYYDKYVADYGMVLLGSVKEKEIPASVGSIPNAPILNSENLQVVAINKHISDSDETSTMQKLMETVSSKKQLIAGYNNDIDAKKKKINSDNATVETTKQTQQEISAIVENKHKAQEELDTALSAITSAIQNGNNVVVAPKYRIRGFVNIPDPKEGDYGKEYVVQMVVSYRYKSTNGSSTNNNNMTILDENGNTINAFFPQWTEIKSPVRRKVYDEKLGIYVWADEDISDSNVEHINQIDIPITRGEIVEVRVKAISEAGFPTNGLESEWSNTVEVSFPSQYETSNESEYLAEQYLIENSLSKFNQELISRGVDDHLEDSLYVNDRYFAHNLENIYYGYASTSSTRLISAKEKIDELERRLNEMSSSVTSTYGQLKVTLLDRNNNKTIDVTNNSTIQLENLYSKSNGGYSGHILYNRYTVKISSTSNTYLELISYFGDGVGFIPAAENPSDDNPRYDLASVNLFGKSNTPYGTEMNDNKFQSRQVKQQYVLFRGKDLDGNELYYTPNSDDFAPDYTENFDLDSRKLLPHIKSVGTDTISSNNSYLCMKGTELTSVKAEPTEFCILTGPNGLPDKYFLNNKKEAIYNSFSGFNNPDIDKSGLNSYLRISHTRCFCIPENYNYGDIKYYQQNSFFKPGEASTLNPGDFQPTNKYADKIGFDSEYDIYLVGKNTCGMYLYPTIKDYDEISVVNGSKKVGIDNSVSFDITCQYRLKDRLDNIGGYTDDVDSVSYRKKLGIDIFRRSEISSKFSFDIDVKCYYAD